MDLLDQRDNNGHDSILKKRFIQSVMQEAKEDIDKAQRNYLSSRGFEANDWYDGRGFTVSTDGLEYTHLKKHRFVDMKTRRTKEGIKKKRSHPIHNRIIWGHYNNIIKELHFGFTEEIKEKLRNID